MPLDGIQLIQLIGDLLAQGTVVAVVTGMLLLSLVLNWMQYRAKDQLYDRLIEAETNRADSAEKNTTALITELMQVRMVLSEIREIQGNDPALALPEEPTTEADPA